MPDEWYVYPAAKKDGPFTADELKELASEGELDPNDLLLEDGAGSAVAASAAKGLAVSEAGTERPARTRNTEPSTPPRASVLRNRRVIVAACAAGLLVVAVVIVASRGRTPTPVVNNPDEREIVTRASGGKQPGPTSDGGDKTPSGPPNPPKLTPAMRPVADVPPPAFDKSPPNAEFDFSKLDYTKGPSGEPLRAVDGIDRDPDRLTADGGVPVGKSRIHVFVNRQGQPVQHGVETHWFLNGTKSQECYWWDGQRHGTIHKWHENGTLGAKGMSVNGKPHGVGWTFHPNGKKSSEMTFVNGVMTGYAAKWYEDGSLSFEGVSKDGKKHGPLVEYYPGGQRRVQKTYANGAEDGDAYGWFKSGQLQWRQTTRGGKLVGIETNWNRHGQVAYELDWGDGKTTPSVVRRYAWASATKGELKDTIVGVSKANVVESGKVFQATLETTRFEQAFGKPDSDAGTGDERLWTFRCQDGAITFRVMILGAGVTQFKRIERE